MLGNLKFDSIFYCFVKSMALFGQHQKDKNKKKNHEA
jgi:hypothetical protein